MNLASLLFTESGLSRVMTAYMDTGFIVVSPDRTPEAEGLEPPEALERNKRAREQIKQDIKSAGFGFVPTFGGYKELVVDPKTGKESRVDSKSPEHGFLIPNRKTGREEQGTWDRLVELGTELSKKFNQDSFLVKPPNSVDPNAYYLDQSGNTAQTFEGPVTPNDLVADYFTQLKKGSKGRFTFAEATINPAPKSAGEARLRYGEIFFR